MGGVQGTLVVANMPGALTVVAGLPLVARAVLELRAAGYAAVTVFAGPQARRVAALLEPRCPDVAGLGSPDEAAALGWPELVLVVAGDVLFDPAALAPLLAAATPGGVHFGQVPGAPGPEVPAAVCPGSAIPRLLAEASRGGGLRVEGLRRVGGAAAGGVPLTDGLLVPADRAPARRVLETALLDHLARRTSAKDSFLAALVDRRLSRPLTRLLLGSPVTPSQITVVSIALGLAGAVGLATISYAGRLAGVGALIASIVLDCVDGELARARFQQSAAGARLDVLGDYVVHLAAFLGLAIGLARQGLPPGGVWAAAGLVAGVGAAMATMHAIFVRPALRGGGDLHWSGEPAGLPDTPLTAIVEKLASRDYTYLLLVLALLGHLEWFLYAAAVGSWVFVAGVLGYRGYQRLALRRPVVSQ
ncbi:MAG TPA: CDP-alcohol phosphatidyltransferase family protein [Methylomirabilota bacterium]|jgi:phosphatidylglycerophosphate synthase|nr:CDP-alcohol phosphatidyltransferase family protein [Methylomirabilota bacterium]